MSEVEELQNEIIVDFNNNDTFSKIKNQVEEPKPKRISTKKIIAEQVEAVEAVEDIEDIKPKPKRKPTNKIIIEESEDIEDIKPKPKRKSTKQIIVEDLKLPELVIEAEKKNIKTLEMVDCEKCGKQMTKTTLRYHHDKTCPGEKVNKEELPVKKELLKIRLLPKLLNPNQIRLQHIKID